MTGVGCARYRWCVVDHSVPEWAHSHRAAYVTVGTTEVYPLATDDDGCEVRVHTPGFKLELEPALAADLADLLDGIDPATVAGVAGAIRAAAAALGEDPR